MIKKILILLVFIFLSSGCYDYTELNNMAIVSGISVDYKDDLFEVCFEILNTTNKEENPDSNKVYLTFGKGENLYEAFSDASLEIAKLPYMAHLKTLIISEEVAKYHVEEIIDYLLRDNHIRNIFYLTIAKDVSAYEIISHTNSNNPVVSSAIQKLIDSDLFTNNIKSTLNFEEFTVNIIDKRKDTYATTIELKDDTLKLGPLAIFKDYEMKTILSEEESATFNVINGDSEEIHFNVNCPNDENKNIILTTFNKPKSEIEINNENVLIKSEVEVKVIENHCELDFKKIETYQEIQNKVQDNLKEKMIKLVNETFKYDSDILKIKQKYYQKFKKDVDFKNLNYNYSTKAIINRNGLIFEVKEND